MQATFDQAVQALKLLRDQEVGRKGYQDIFDLGVLSDVALAASLGRLPTENKVAQTRGKGSYFG